MFGFLRGPDDDRVYRQLYAWCCSSNRDWLGLRSLPFVSYEAIFACSLAVDCGLVCPPPEDSATCCKTSRRHSAFRSASHPGNVTAARFGGAFAMLLARVKLDDDIRDANSRLAKLAKWVLRRECERSESFFDQQSSMFAANLDRLLEEHANLEAGDSGIELEAYVRPTGDAFSSVFELLPAAIARSGGDSADVFLLETFRQAGRHVGQALIAFDCAVDYRRDRKLGHFNPLRSNAEVREAYEFSQRQLIELGWLIASRLGTDPISLISCRTLRHRIATIRSRSRLDASGRKTTKSRVGLRVPRRLRAGICDCDCGGCDCPLCDCGVADGAEAATDGCRGMPCPCECLAEGCCLPVTPGRTANETSEITAAATTNSWNGRTGEVVVALSPYGTVKLSDEPGGGDHPAKSDGEMIPAGKRVRVIRKEAFGLLVRPLPEGDDDSPRAASNSA